VALFGLCRGGSYQTECFVAPGGLQQASKTILITDNQPALILVMLDREVPKCPAPGWRFSAFNAFATALNRACGIDKA